MMKRTTILLYIFLLAAVHACVYPYNPDLQSETGDILVVDGDIVVGATSTIRISYMVPLGGTSVKHPFGTARIEDDGGNVYKSASSGFTSTFIINMNDAPEDRKYRAVIEADGNTYISDWLEPIAPPTINDVRFQADDKSVSVMVDVDAGENGTGYIGLSFDECWEFHSDFYPEVGIDPQSWSYFTYISPYPYYWCWMYASSRQVTLANYTILAGTLVKNYAVHSFPRTDSRNHRKYSILVKAHNMSEEAYRYEHYQQEISQSGGDLFSPDPGQMHGNMSCSTDSGQMVLGMVRAARVSTKRAFLRGVYLVSQPADTGTLVLVSEDDMPTYYTNMGYRPAVYISNDEGSGYGWGHERCINCIVAGGTQQEPSFWDDDL